MSHNYNAEELRQRALERVQEWQDIIPGYRERVLERLINNEMYREALSYNGDLDYQERLKEWNEKQQQEHSTPVKCLCSKIKELFNRE